jgi:outer membrane lipoprotein SlyB
VITEKAEAAVVAKAPVKPKVINKPAHATPAAAPDTAAVPAAPAVVTPPVANLPADAPVATAPAVFQSQTKPLCINCGTVDSVTPVERVGHAVGVGAVAGGVLGAVVGNQVGQGSGRTVATILGALGGGFAGNTVEKNMKKTTQYEIRVRMEDGTVRTFEQATPMPAGARVIIDNGALRLAPRVAAPVEHSVVDGQTAPKVYSTQ